jgi:DNA primase
LKYRRGKRRPGASEARRVRKAADIEALLRRLGIKFERRDDDLYALCPNPGHSEKDPSWHIRSVTGDPKNGVFNCWSCKWTGDVFTLVSEIRKVDFARALAFVKTFAKPEASRPAATVSDDDYTRNLRAVEPPEIGFFWPNADGDLEPFDPRRIAEGTPCGNYLASRWIGSQYIERHGFLDWPEKNRVVVPIRRRGRMISWIARSYNGGKPKTFAPKGAPKRWELFGLDYLDRSVPEVNLVEGWVDHIRISQIRTLNALALCGSKMTEPQVEEILFAQRIIVWMDGDKAGEVLAGDVAAWLGRGRTLMIVEMPKGKDPGDYSPKEISSFQAEPWNDYKRRTQCRT